MIRTPSNRAKLDDRFHETGLSGTGSLLADSSSLCSRASRQPTVEPATRLSRLSSDQAAHAHDFAKLPAYAICEGVTTTLVPTGDVLREFIGKAVLGMPLF